MKTACLLLLVAVWGCTSVSESALDLAPTAPASVASRDPSLIRLSADAAQRGGVELGRVEEVQLAESFSAPGEVRWNADRTVQVGAFVEGIVTECCKSVGTYVEKGESLAELHSHQTHELLASYRAAWARLESRRAEASYAQTALERAVRLHQMKAGSLQKVQEAEAALATAHATVQTAEAELDGALAHFEYLGIETGDLVEGQVPEHLEIHVRAPQAGVVVERSVSSGSVVTPSTPLYSLSDLSRVWLVVRVAQDRLSALRVGMPIELRVRAFGDRVFPGRVERIADALDADTKTVQVRCSVANPSRMLKAGMYGEVLLRSTRRRPALLVDEAAVQLIDGESVVFVPQQSADQDSLFRPHVVSTGAEREGRIEIVDGLAAGDALVVGGAFILKSELLKSRFSEE